MAKLEILLCYHAVWAFLELKKSGKLKDWIVEEMTSYSGDFGPPPLNPTKDLKEVTVTSY